MALMVSPEMDQTDLIKIDRKEVEGNISQAFEEDVDQERSPSNLSEPIDVIEQTEERNYAVNCDKINQFSGPYAGMPKEVLLEYSSQICYRLPREILFWLIIAATLVLVACTISIIAISPKCLDWWQASPIYQIYPRSFKDSDGNGVGDLNGIKEKMDYFVGLNIKAIWISPVYKSPMKDFGYDVEDFEDIDPIFGTMEEFDSLLKTVHDKGLKLIMDFIPNHTSNKHRWFQLSRNRTGKYTDYYIWVNCKSELNKTTSPNNWVSLFGYSAWQYDEVRGQCYLHQFLKEQPDLNYRNTDVQEEMKNVLRFWLKKGVDGFRVDAVKYLLEAESLRNEPQVNLTQDPSNITSYNELYHDYTTTQVGIHDIVRSWRHVLNEFSTEPGRYRFIMTESYDNGELYKTMMYYGTPLQQEADFPFNFYLIDLDKDMSGNGIFKIVDYWMHNMPEGKWPNWVVGNHDNSRVASRIGVLYTDVVNMLLMTLPGTPTTYYGEELGMENIHVPEDEIQDPFGKFDPTQNRDPQRSPMQWDTSANAGFSTANKTWLSIHSNYMTVNVEVEKKEQNSSLNLYRELSFLRQKELPIHRGWMCYIWNDTDVFAYVRELDGLDSAFLIVLNFGKASVINLASKVPYLPKEANARLGTDSNKKGNKVQTASIVTSAGEGLVLEYRTHNPVHNMVEFKDKCYISQKACYLSSLGLLYKNC
ncbi:neutral and basic amino acid transport protein rBAT [Amblyraja radiata]|uniref:neutral and basic amino acid transport protein rBAT n=1 Tax=Amblyraja radiata TaxID=386614 RepID=UPI001401F099|nr:neutral and basic amino acid transport protein rBAT [Amblyraja radiata]